MTQVSRTRRLARTALLAALASAAAASAADFLVNVTTSGGQEDASVASDDHGNTFVVWVDEGVDPECVRGRHFPVFGTPGPEITISDLSRLGFDPSVSASDAGFLVVWHETVGSTMDVVARRYTRAGLVAGARVPVEQVSFDSTFTRGARGALFDDGSFVVAWAPPEGAGSDPNDSIEGRRFAADGTGAAQFQINTDDAAEQQDPDVAVRYGDGFVVTWSEERELGVHAVARRFGPRDGGLGPELEVGPQVDEPLEFVPQVATAVDGSFVVAWETYEPYGFGRRFDRNGAADASFPLAASPEWEVDNPQVAAEPWGAFTTVWYSDDPAGDDVSGRSIQLREHYANGQPIGLEQQVNTYTTGSQAEPEVAVDGDGDRFVVWHGDFAPADPGRGIVASRLPGPVAAAWRLDEGSGNTILDTAEADNDDGNNNGAAWVNGRFGKALAFDGVADYVYVVPTADLDDLSQQVAITAWVRPDALGGAMPDDYGGIFDSVEDNYVLYLDQAAGELRFKVTPATGPGFALRVGIPQAALTTGHWHHVAGTFDGLTARIYLDGVLVDAASLASPSPVRTVPEQEPAIGRNGSTGAGAADHHFYGAIDELRVWRRPPSAAEILLMARPPLVLDGFESGDTAGWHAEVP